MSLLFFKYIFDNAFTLKGWLQIGLNHINLFPFCQIFTLSRDRGGHMAPCWPMRIRRSLLEASGRLLSSLTKGNLFYFFFLLLEDRNDNNCGWHFVNMRLHENEKPTHWQSRREAKNKHWLKPRADLDQLLNNLFNESNKCLKLLMLLIWVFCY